jgi:hypothetical protein
MIALTRLRVQQEQRTTVTVGVAKPPISALGQKATSAGEPTKSAVLPRADIGDGRCNVGFGPIVLKKSFWEGERKFLEPLMRFARGDVRDHIDSSKIDHGPP